VAPAPVHHATNGAEPEVEPHTAPHDEIVAVVRDLMAASHGRAVSIDALSNALKARGFRRPPGSLRLVTRLRRIKELAVSRSGSITLVDEPAPEEVAESPSEAAYAAAYELEPGHVEDAGSSDAGAGPANDSDAVQQTAGPSRSRRRRRRGGRRRRGRGGGASVVAAP
jgi:hypothetical protein